MTAWSVVELIRWTADYLADRGLDEPRLNAELLLGDTLGCRRLDLYLQHDRPLGADELARFKSRLLRRARREPLQYIAGETAFRDLRLHVDRRVLIPRPETEILVDCILEWSRGRTGLTGLDLGTGSGAIALSLATEGDAFDSLVATDISVDALEVARENRTVVDPSRPVDLRAGPGYEPVRGMRFDVIVSNPPYIGERERASLQPEVREWEPDVALFSGEDGLLLIRELVSGAPAYLRDGGLFALEIGADQARDVAGMVREVGAFREPMVRVDLAGRERIVMAELA